VTLSAAVMVIDDSVKATVATARATRLAALAGDDAFSEFLDFDAVGRAVALELLRSQRRESIGTDPLFRSDRP
jgi:hypothetical protein